MDSFVSWFKSNGDHFLNQVSIFLLGGQATGMLPAGWKYAPLVTVVLSFLHTVFVPDQPAPAPKAATPATPAKS
jgi:hypothetical protein